MNKIKQVFNGDEKLVLTFWLWGFLGSLIWGFLWGFILVAAGMTSPMVISIVGLVYSIFAWVSIWRSSDKYTGQKIWAILAKVMVVLGVVWTVYGFINPTPMPSF